jgi:hypothetical protein
MRYLVIKNQNSDNKFTLIPESQILYFSYDGGMFYAYIKQGSTVNSGVKNKIECGPKVKWNEFDGTRKDWSLT